MECIQRIYILLGCLIGQLRDIHNRGQVVNDGHWLVLNQYVMGIPGGWMR